MIFAQGPVLRQPMRASLLALSLFVVCHVLGQQPDVEGWMARRFGGNEQAAQDPAADLAVHRLFGMDSLRANRFLGRCIGTCSTTRGEQVRFVLWTDALHGLLQLIAPEDTVTFLADLPANTMTIAQASNEKRTAAINDLRDGVIMARLLRAQDPPWRIHRTTLPSQRFAGQGCDQHIAIAGRDTIRFWRSHHYPSPFVDALEWMPYGSSAPIPWFAVMAQAGDPIPMELTHPYGSVAIERIDPGVERPAFDLASYQLTDRRRGLSEPVPIRISNARTVTWEALPPPDGHEPLPDVHEPEMPVAVPDR